MLNCFIFEKPTTYIIICYLEKSSIYRLQVESPDTKFKSFIKLTIAFCYCTASLLITAFVMVLVHDRVPGELLFITEILFKNI